MLIVFIQSILIVHSCSIQNCEFCSPNFHETCLNCNLGYTRDLDIGCKASQSSELSLYRIENCLELQNSTCIQCQEGYKLINGYCEPICSSSNCSCFYPNTCFHQSRSISCDSTACAYCDDNFQNCVSCKDGLGLDEQNSCVKCSNIECLKCSVNFTQCQECTIKTYLDDFNCFYCDSIFCSYCDEKSKRCNYCEEGLDLDLNGFCCHPSCLTCSKDNWNCSSCNEGYYLNNLCYNCVSNCKHCTNNTLCNECYDGYELINNNECVGKICHTKKCSSCPNSINNCLKCFEGYFLDSQNHCCDSNCKTCNEDSSFCISCNNGMYLDGLKCMNCTDGCLSCNNLADCILCADGYLLYSGICKKINPEESPFKLPAIISIVIIFVIGTFIMLIWFHIENRQMKMQIKHEAIKQKHELSIENNQSIEPMDLFHKVNLDSDHLAPNFSDSKRSSHDKNYIKNLKSDTVPQSATILVSPLTPPLSSKIDDELQSSNLNYLEHQDSLPKIFKPVYENSEDISIQNFGFVVQTIQLDIENAYNEIKVCYICQKEFDKNSDIRALPCGHPYHGKCIYNAMIIENKKQCLCCFKTYT
ncbi:hypothetical protein SteCoe_5206 [Stentor coeruleus]|uniref:RING-type domain-containing protein n=1 Tax=Stentor coeruleus TaxID=5963 RepID=A0A1R2CSV9_9CILI|nr:hypothetical protein SteCoe_5206 [Stentor coeruleus]